MGIELDANSTIEICTGRKKTFPKTARFQMLKSGRFKKLREKTNYLGITNRRYNFYLGGTDSCQGNLSFT